MLDQRLARPALREEARRKLAEARDAGDQDAVAMISLGLGYACLESGDLAAGMPRL